jgi:hypothetical protein
MIGVYPLVELPTGNESLGLRAGNMRAYFPLWIQKSFGDCTTYGGGGYWINHGDDTLNRDYWFFGWLLQRQVTKQLAIGGEIFHQTATVVFGGIDSGAATTGFNMGAIYDFDEQPARVRRAPACRMRPRPICSPGTSATKSPDHKPAGLGWNKSGKLLRCPGIDRL